MHKKKKKKAVYERVSTGQSMKMILLFLFVFPALLRRICGYLILAGRSGGNFYRFPHKFFDGMERQVLAGVALSEAAQQEATGVNLHIIYSWVKLHPLAVTISWLFRDAGHYMYL